MIPRVIMNSANVTCVTYVSCELRNSVEYCPHQSRNLVVLEGRMTPQPPVRERLLTAATHLFSEQGYDATSTRDIAKLADADETGIFRIFKSKDKLFAAVVEETFSVALPYVPRIEDDPHLSVPSFLRATLQYWIDNPHRQKLFYRAALSRRPTIRKIIKRYMDRFYGPIAEVMKARMTRGEYRKMDAVLAGPLLLLGAMSSYHLLTEIYSWKEVAGEPIGAPAYLDAMAEVWLRGMEE